MKECIQKYYLDQDNNCAETTLRALNDKYSLGLTETDFKIVGGFGGGCGCGIICGALAGAIGALGSAMVEGRAHATPGFKEACGEFCGRFSAALGSTECAQIRPKYFCEGVRCAQVIDTALDVFDAFAAEKGIG